MDFNSDTLKINKKDSFFIARRNHLLRKNRTLAKWGQLYFSSPLVSSDYIGSSFSSIVDALSTKVIDNFVKIVAWYDNEHGYACRLADFTEFLGERL